MSKWIKNISYSLWGKILAMLFLVLLDISIARILDVDSYAEWVYFSSILTIFFYIGWFGINTSVKVFVSKCVNDKTKINCLIASVVLRFFFSLLISCIIFNVMPRMASYLGYPGKYPNIKWLLFFSSILVFFNSFTELFKEIFMGENEFKKVFSITVVEYLGYFLFSITFLFIFGNIKSIAIGYVASGLTVSLLGWILLLKEHRKNLVLIDMSFLKKIIPILKYAFPIALINFGGLILVEMDTFMLGLIGSKEDVAVYNIAKNLCAKATHINYALTVGVMTSFSIINSENRLRKKKDFDNAARINFGIMSVVSICFLVFADVAINILYGDSYIRASSLLRMLVGYYALYGISTFYSTFLDFRNKAGFRSVCYLSIVVINFTLNYLWIPKYGASGAAIATDLSLIPYTVLVMAESVKEWRAILSI